MNDVLSTASSGAAAERPEIVSERPAATADGARAPAAGPHDVPTRPAPGKGSTRFFRRMAVAIILLFWTTRFSALTLTRFIEFPADRWETLLPRLFITICGLLISFAMFAAQTAVTRASLPRRVLTAIGLAIAGCSVQATLGVTIFSNYASNVALDLPSLALAGMDWLWFYASLSVMLLALTYGADLSESEARVSALQTQADAAQLKALRYQLNPHFLFNTLNSVASLISQKKQAEAETMVVSLSDFLRSTLQMDAVIQIPLGEEIELQSLYLEIEKSRFPQRLVVTIDVPDELRDALVPNLITQPLIENAIKYGVARSSEPVHLEVIGRQIYDKLSLVIRDDGGNAGDSASKGTRVGLRNVSDRLRVQFGEGASLIAGPRPEGGFTARILMPLRRR